MRTLAVCLSLLALACSSTSDAAHDDASASVAAPDSGRLADLLPRPRETFWLRATPTSAPSLEDVLVQLERATGVHFVVPDAAREQLKRRGSGLLSDLEVPPSAAWRVVETMLAENGFLIEPSRAGSPVTITLVALMSNEPGNLKSRAIEIDAAELEECLSHPAVLFLVVIDVDSLDARQLSTSLRQLFPDQHTQSILPVTSSQLLMVGFGPDLVGAARMVQTTNAMRKRELEEARVKDPAAAASATPR